MVNGNQGDEAKERWGQKHMPSFILSFSFSYALQGGEKQKRTLISFCFPTPQQNYPFPQTSFLSSLQKLTMSDLKLTGSIPHEIRDISSLICIDLNSKSSPLSIPFSITPCQFSPLRLKIIIIHPPLMRWMELDPPVPKKSRHREREGGVYFFIEVWQSKNVRA